MGDSRKFLFSTTDKIDVTTRDKEHAMVRSESSEQVTRLAPIASNPLKLFPSREDTLTRSFFGNIIN